MMVTMSMPRRWALLTVLCTGTAATVGAPARQAAAPPPDSAPLSVRFQAELDRLRRELDLPGVTAAYQLADGVAHVVASGAADRELGLPATTDTRMLSGSTGKTFVAALALALADEGKLALDDPIERWLGTESWFERLPNARTITVRMLLNHSSGLEDHVYTEAFGAAIRSLTPDQRFTPADLVAFLLDSKPLFPAGTGFNYSDTGFILAGMLLERAGGAPYYDQIQRRFLYPLDLSLTAPSSGRIHPGLAQGYMTPESPLQGLGLTTLDRGVLRFDPGSEWTGGGLVTSPRDLVRWASALYEGGTRFDGAAWSGRVLGTSARAQMLGSIAPGSGQAEGSGYGLGVYIWRSDFGLEYGHGGLFPGYRTSFAFYPDYHVAVAVQTNTDAPSTESVHEMRRALARVVLTHAETRAAAGVQRQP
jgi:D-alanyl-D-alanine carboxypeptidase